MLLERAIEKEGRLLVPFKHTDAGWTDFHPMMPLAPIHLWAASMADEDWVRLEKLRRGNEAEWHQVTSRGPRSLDDRAWTRFLVGECPDYPEQILSANYRQLCARVEQVMSDDSDLTKINEHHWQERNPVVTEALVQLTTGGPQTIYWGGLAQGQVHYFDPKEQRPGLPSDVAALVTRLAPEGLDLTLVNLSVHATRDVIAGAGSFGEHQFKHVKVVGSDAPVPVDDRYFQVRLLPGTEIDLNITMERFCNKPSYAFPWHGGAIPFR
ncbi:hypothetical protein HYR99_13055 [Candidatus Poribacteria bacterium]|nr:hypothetical protein [Candidatus Poribacteria bacterium]